MPEFESSGVILKHRRIADEPGVLTVHWHDTQLRDGDVVVHREVFKPRESTRDGTEQQSVRSGRERYDVLESVDYSTHIPSCAIPHRETSQAVQFHKARTS